MKAITIISSCILFISSFIITSTNGFAPSLNNPIRNNLSTQTYMSVNKDSAELQAAIADVRKAASAFSDDTAAFATKWIDNLLENQGKESALGMLDECIIDFEEESSEKCDAFEAALKKLDKILNLSANVQF